MELKVEYVSIESLKKYANNAKIHTEKQIRQIADSIQAFGFNDPIGIWKNEIVEGHGRLDAARLLKLDTVPIIRLDHMSNKERKAYILAHNKLTMNTGFDDELLKLEFEELKLEGLDLGLTGFDMLDFEEEKEVKEDDFDVAEQLKKPVMSKLGDIWLLGRHRLMCGDSTDKATVEKLMDGKKADMVFTDPPYGISVVKNNKVGADFGIAKKGNYSKVIADETTETAEKSFNILSEISKKQIIWGGNYFTKFLPFSDGWILWDKREDTGIKNTFADGEMAWCSFHTPIRIYRQLWNGMIRKGEHSKRVHPTQKPVKTLSDIISDFTEKNNIILDVFGGSGSTLIACQQTNRICFMLELDENYCDVIVNRYKEFVGSAEDIKCIRDGETYSYTDIFAI